MRGWLFDWLRRCSIGDRGRKFGCLKSRDFRKHDLFQCDHRRVIWKETGLLLGLIESLENRIDLILRRLRNHSEDPIYLPCPVDQRVDDHKLWSLLDQITVCGNAGPGEKALTVPGR